MIHEIDTPPPALWRNRSSQANFGVFCFSLWFSLGCLSPSVTVQVHEEMEYTDLEPGLQLPGETKAVSRA